MKWLKYLPVLLALAIGVTGCMVPKTSFQDEALSYMQKKYDTAFTWVEPVGGQMGEKRKNGYLSVEAFPGEKIFVTGIPGEKDSFQDNYAAYLVQEEAEAAVNAIAGSGWKIFCQPEEVGLSLGKDCSAMEYLRSGGVQLKVFAVTDDLIGWESVRDSRMEALRQALWAEGIAANLSVRVISSQKAAAITGENRDSFLQGPGDGRFSMDSRGNYTIAKWR